MIKILSSILFLVSFSFIRFEKKNEVFVFLDNESLGCNGSVEGSGAFVEKKHIISTAAWHIFRETIHKKARQEDGTCPTDVDQGYVGLVELENVINKYSI